MDAKIVHEKLRKSKRKLAVAESCTGGLLMATLTQFAGASDYLVGGVVAYANKVKEEMLKVRSIQAKGAVSSDVVREMVEGLFLVTAAEIGIAVSGFFGPEGDPVGLVWMAIGERDKWVRSEQILLKAGLSRGKYREQTVNYLLEALWKL